MKAWKWILILAIIVVLTVATLFLLNLLGINFLSLSIISRIRPSDLTVDTNRACIVRYDYENSCVWEGHISAPKYADNISFYISIGAYPEITSTNKFKVEVWNTEIGNYENIFERQLAESVSGGFASFTYFSQEPGNEITWTGYVADNLVSHWACEKGKEQETLTKCREKYNGWGLGVECKCMFYPDCFVYFEEMEPGIPKRHCVMPKFVLGSKYINNEVKFRTSLTSIRGNDMVPNKYDSISIFESEFGINYEKLCEGVECPDKCDGNKRLYDGWCDKSTGECKYKEFECEECQNGKCITYPCRGIECDDYCENSVWYYNGNCADGKCVYDSKDTCEFGCQEPPILLSVVVGEGMCRGDPCIGITCPDYCIEDDKNTLATEGKCVNGKCVYPIGGEKSYSEECGYTPLYKKWYIWVGSITFIIVVILSYLYYRRRLK